MARLQLTTLVLVALLVLVSLSSTAAKTQTEVGSPKNQTGVQTSVNVSLSVGCPDFLEAFNAANTSASDEPFFTFTLTKGTSYAYVSVHFAKLWVPLGASVMLRAVEDFATPDTVLNISKSLVSGEMHLNRSSPALRAKELRVEVYRSDDVLVDEERVSEPLSADRQCFGFVVDSYMFDAISSEPNTSTPAVEATCGQDNTEEAICYYATNKPAYMASRAVARLLTTMSSGQSSACTGWLLGSEGHVITNHHCVQDADEAARTTVEFMADASVCQSSCTKWGGCEGTVEALSAKIVYTSAELDFTLLQLVQVDPSVDLPRKYGFLRLKATPGRVGQPIYIPQHPLYYGKRIAMVDDYKLRLTLTDVNASGCDGSGFNTSGYAYKGDTQRGSSGAPVIDADDHGVVALHRCGQSCYNTGVPSADILSALQASGMLPANATDVGSQCNEDDWPSFTPQEAAVPLTLEQQLQFDGAIRAVGVANGTTTVSVDQIEFTLLRDADVEFDVLSVELADNGVFSDLNGDCRAQYLDAVMFLFAKGAGPTALKIADDSDAGTGTADGSVSYRDPYLRTFLKKGSYVLALGSVPLRAADAYAGAAIEQRKTELFQCSNRGSDYGAYRVTVRASAPLSFEQLPEKVSPELPLSKCTQGPATCYV